MTITPTSFDEAFGELALEMIAESGRTLLLSQPVRAEVASGVNAGAVVESPLSGAELTLHGNHLSGSSVVSLAAEGVSGLLIVGDSLTIDGEPHAVTGGPYAVSLTSTESLSDPDATVGDDEVSSGVTRLNLIAAGGATGAVFDGDSFLVDGDPTVYTVVGGPYPVSVDGFLSDVEFVPPLDLPTGSGVAVHFTLQEQVAVAIIANVEISPELAGDVASGAAVTVSFSGTYTPIKGVVSNVSTRLIAAGVAKVGDFEVMVSRAALEALGVTIAAGDELHFGPDTSSRLAVVEKVLPIASGELDAAFTLIARLR
ncbi:MAG: hypothetical protein ABI639_17595 [Thermoanaerobaculia bacterium]